MKKLFSWLSRRHWYVSVPIVIFAGVVAFLLISNGLQLVNSNGFCGKTCHVMKPENTAYQSSFHSRVDCVACHVGDGLIAEIRAKAQGTKELWLYVTNTFERPIPSPVESLRPARETCEECHWPEVFYEDRAKEIPHYSNDAFNTRTTTYMLVKIGGGTERQGLGREIHWHIENPIEYIAVDNQRQNIPWLRAQLDGKTVVFQDQVNPLTEEEIQTAEIRTMDCIDCHNRATHIFRSASVAVDEAMANGVIPTDLPFLRKTAVETMNAEYPDQDSALAAIDEIANFYETTFTGLYTQRKDEILKTVGTLKDMYSSSHFPEYKVYPDTYPDNIGHSESPGCFRCHDGKHLSDDDQSIRLHCNICHTIPQTVAAGEPAPELSFDQRPQPASHLASGWMADHRYVMDASCAGCHNMSSFCSNSNCHGRSWPYVNLAVIAPPFPIKSPEAATRQPATQQPVAQQPTTQQPATQQPAGRAPAPAPAPAPEAKETTQQPAPTKTAESETPQQQQQQQQQAKKPVSFSSQILPVLTAKCAATCHSPTAAVGGFIAADYAGVVAHVTPGDPAGSTLVKVQSAEHPMKLTAEELSLVSDWIEQGALDN